MKNFFLILLFCLPLSSFSQNQYEEKDLKWLKQLLESKSDTMYMLNFWATWCLPCVEELPEFEKFRDNLNNKQSQLIFISLDAPRTAAKKMSAFLTKKKVPGQIIVINAPDYNEWINLVDKSWQGSLPATLFFRGSDGKHWFSESTLTAPELLKVSQQFLTP